MDPVRWLMGLRARCVSHVAQADQETCLVVVNALVEDEARIEIEATAMLQDETKVTGGD